MSSSDLIEQQLATESQAFYIGKVGARLELAIGLADALLNDVIDPIKKSVFYGKQMDDNFGNAAAYLGRCAAGLVLADLHDDPPTAIGGNLQDHARMVHAVLGKLTECGELIQILVKISRGEPIDWDNVYEEMGDDSWYDAILIDLGRKHDPKGAERWDPLMIQQANVDKLRVRYPNKFTEHDALNRNTVKEMDAVNGTSTD